MFVRRRPCRYVVGVGCVLCVYLTSIYLSINVALYYPSEWTRLKSHNTPDEDGGMNVCWLLCAPTVVRVSLTPPPGLLSVSSPRSGGRRTFSPGVGWISASSMSCLIWQLILSHISIRITCPVLPPERAQATCRRHLPRGGIERSGSRLPLPHQCKPKEL